MTEAERLVCEDPLAPCWTFCTAEPAREDCDSLPAPANYVCGMPFYGYPPRAIDAAEAYAEQ